MQEGFRLSAGTAQATGYSKNQDFPGQKSSPTRGELFQVEGDKNSKGVGTSLAKDAIGLMASEGAQTVNINPTTAQGRALVERLISDGVISAPIQTAPTGKAEYRILASSGQPRIQQTPNQQVINEQSERPQAAPGAQVETDGDSAQRGQAAATEPSGARDTPASDAGAVEAEPAQGGVTQQKTPKQPEAEGGRVEASVAQDVAVSDAPAAATPADKTARRLDRIPLEIDVMVDGERQRVRGMASTWVAQSDERLDRLQTLRDCAKG